MTREEEIIKASHLYASSLQKPFMDGAKWADKTMLAKATEWLSANLHRYDESIGLGVKEFVGRFKKAMGKPAVLLWHPADGNYLPEVERDVIALRGIKNPVTTASSWGYEVVFAHRPNPDGWDGKSITTGEVEHYDVQTYDKGGWNIPDVKYWLDCELPKMEE